MGSSFSSTRDGTSSSRTVAGVPPLNLHKVGHPHPAEAQASTPMHQPQASDDLGFVQVMKLLNLSRFNTQCAGGPCTRDGEGDVSVLRAAYPSDHDASRVRSNEEFPGAGTADAPPHAYSNPLGMRAPSSTGTAFDPFNHVEADEGIVIAPSHRAQTNYTFFAREDTLRREPTDSYKELFSQGALFACTQVEQSSKLEECHTARSIGAGPNASSAATSDAFGYSPRGQSCVSSSSEASGASIASDKSRPHVKTERTPPLAVAAGDLVQTETLCPALEPPQPNTTRSSDSNESFSSMGCEPIPDEFGQAIPEETGAHIEVSSSKPKWHGALDIGVESPEHVAETSEMGESNAAHLPRRSINVMAMVTRTSEEGASFYALEDPEAIRDLGIPEGFDDTDEPPAQRLAPGIARRNAVAPQPAAATCNRRRDPAQVFETLKGLSDLDEVPLELPRTRGKKCVTQPSIQRGRTEQSLGLRAMAPVHQIQDKVILPCT